MSKLHGGIEEIIRTGKCPATKVGWRPKRKEVSRKGDGCYVSGLADFSGDPDAFCSTRYEAEEKMKRKGLDFEKTQ